MRFDRRAELSEKINSVPWDNFYKKEIIFSNVHKILNFHTSGEKKNTEYKKNVFSTDPCNYTEYVYKILKESRLQKCT